MIWPMKFHFRKAVVNCFKPCGWLCFLFTHHNQGSAPECYPIPKTVSTRANLSIFEYPSYLPDWFLRWVATHPILATRVVLSGIGWVSILARKWPFLTSTVPTKGAFWCYPYPNTRISGVYYAFRVPVVPSTRHTHQLTGVRISTGS